jgi:hypothetical protein
MRRGPANILGDMRCGLVDEFEIAQRGIVDRAALCKFRGIQR